MANGKWQMRPGKANAMQSSVCLDARNVEKAGRRHFAGLTHLDHQSRQYAGAPSLVRPPALDRAGRFALAWPHIH
jgi:hypothetical protein